MTVAIQSFLERANGIATGASLPHPRHSATDDELRFGPSGHHDTAEGSGAFAGHFAAEAVEVAAALDLVFDVVAGKAHPGELCAKFAFLERGDRSSPRLPSPAKLGSTVARHQFVIALAILGPVRCGVLALRCTR
jgi:hypothetical protein